MTCTDDEAFQCPFVGLVALPDLLGAYLLVLLVFRGAGTAALVPWLDHTLVVLRAPDEEEEEDHKLLGFQYSCNNNHPSTQHIYINIIRHTTHTQHTDTHMYTISQSEKSTHNQHTHRNTTEAQATINKTNKQTKQTNKQNKQTTKN